MPDFKKQYKKPPLTFGDTRMIKMSLVHEQQEQRKKCRMQNFEENRKEKNSSRSISQINEVRKKLSEWKAKRERTKKTEKLQKKPPFVVGIVHHRVFSPVTNTNVTITNKKTTEQAHKKSNINRGITKATKKRLLAKMTNAAKQKMSENSVTKKSFTNNEIKSDINTRKSFAPPNHKFNPPAGLPKIVISEKTFIEYNPNENNIPAHDKSTENVIEEFDHCNTDSIEEITLKLSFNEQETLDSSQKERINSTEKSILNNSNGKTLSLEISLLRAEKIDATAATEKENCMKNSISSPKHLRNTENNINENKQDNSDLRQISLFDELPIKDAIKRENSDRPMEEKEYTEYFKDLLYKERDRLQKLCDKWTEIQSQDNISEDVWYQINQAIGQTTLLIKEKFKQFHGLVLDYERDGMLINCADLHGFWDMMYIEVKNCDSRFAKLENFHARNRQEEQSSLAKSIGSTKKIIDKKQVVSVKRNLSRELISVDEEKKIEIQNNKEDSQKIININNRYSMPSVSERAVLEKDLNAIHHSKFLEPCTPVNPIYTSTPIGNNVSSSTPNRLNIESASLITMKINQLYNKSTIQLNDTMLYKIGQTPKRSAIDKLGKLRISGISARENDSDYVTSTKSFEEKLKVPQDLRVLSKKINNLKFDELNLHKRSHIQRKLESDSSSIGSSYETVLEKTMKQE